jgi:hypothetical protein
MKPLNLYNLSRISPEIKKYHSIIGYLMILLQNTGRKPNVKVFKIV